MKLFDELTDKNFEMFAVRHYYNPVCADPDEFYEDLNRFKYLKRLITRYNETRTPSVKLILNHLVVIFNVFGIDAGLKMLHHKVKRDKDWSIIKPFLLYLRVIDNTKYLDIPMDKLIIEGLRGL
jgi:hypothetical protein